jgi:hypothetical protein
MITTELAWNGNALEGQSILRQWKKNATAA